MASNEYQQVPCTSSGAEELELFLSSVIAPSLDSDASSLSDLDSEDVEIFQREDCQLYDVSDEEGDDSIHEGLPAPEIVQAGSKVASGSIKSQNFPDVPSPSSDYHTASCANIDVTKEEPRKEEELFPSMAQQLIDEEDLETMLQQLIDGVRLGMAAQDLEDAVPPSILSIENNSKNRQEQTMERLAELSARQSQARTPETRLKGEHEVDTCRPNVNKKKNSMVRTRRSNENIPTVFIDLRDTSSSPSRMTGTDHSGGEPERKNLQRADVPQSVHTGKSALLRQLRSNKMRPRSPPPDHNPQQPVTGGPEPPKKIRSRLKQRQNQRVDVSLSNVQNKEEEVVPERDGSNKEEVPERDGSNKEEVPERDGSNKEEVPERDGSNKEEVPERDGSNKEEDPKVESPSIKNTEPKKRLENSSTEEQSQREKQYREKKSRENMQTQLERMKPRTSVSGWQPMAEQTPVLFHPEASYSPKIDTLPAGSQAEVLLLTIWLSSCGQVLMPGQHTSRSALSTHLMANAYNALLTWLLSLVAPLNPYYEGDAPFQVLGLQQMWREEGLALYACVSPREVSAHKRTKMQKHKGKKDFRGTSGFYQQVSLFLSHHTLQSVTPWKENVKQQLQGQLFPLNLEVPTMKLSSVVMLNPDPQAVEKVFSSPSGFFWQTLEAEEKLSPLAQEIFQEGDIEVVPVIVYNTLLQDAVALHHALHVILTSGLDVCGIRLLYPESSVLRPNIYTIPPSYVGDVKTLPVLAMALRGYHAGKTWESIAGPCDPQLARQTDQNSLSALYGLTRESPLLRYSRTSGNILRDLSLWFGGRIPSSGIVSPRICYPSGRSIPPRSQSPTASQCHPPALLTATTRGDVFLVVSPVVPPCAYGDVIDTCCQRGFAIHGIRRLHLSAKRGALLNMSPTQVSFFCPTKQSSHPEDKLNISIPEPHHHCLLLLLRKENAGHHTRALLQGLMNDLAEQGLLGVIRSNIPRPEHLDHTICFHAVPFSDSLLQSLGGNLHSVPDPDTVWRMRSRQPVNLDPEVEQVVVLTISGRQALQKAGHFLRHILRPKPKIQETVTAGNGCEGFELLGMKWMPSLSWAQAKEVTPYDVGGQVWRESVQQLASIPALVCVLRRVRAFSILANTIKDFIPVTGKQQQHHFIMSATSEVAFRQAVHIFTERDLVSDSQSRPVLKYIAPPRIHSRLGGSGEHRGPAESIFTYMLSGPPLLYTVLLLKPGSWSSHLGRILREIELQRFVLVGMKLETLTTEDSLQIIPTEAKEEKSVCQAHCDYLTSAPSLVLCLQRINAVLKLLDLLGPDDPQLCKVQDQFFWRAQYGTSPVRNAMYGSTSYQAAIREIKRFFPDGLVCDSQSIVLQAEQIPRMKQDAIFNNRRKRQTLKNQLCSNGPSQDTGSPFPSALCQTTCLLFPSRTLGGSSPAYIKGLEELSRRAFRITGARLTVFDQSQAQLVAELYSLQDSLSAEFKAEIAGPCLLVAAHRDNAVTCFHSLMASHNLQKEQKRTAFILSPESQRQAVGMISCFFDSLTPDSIHRIVPQVS
ncbi:dynein axonemal assembly factor 8-like isoform X2 [Dendropsophus ebraccatus]|uniref:dynein axonemal assembly factor 8-like isoform X2 n=1 Tax=Dendropsophus ebraccatus TaxID=150705 RepID=UPI00383174AF